jgi:hypothetical protein
MGQTSTAWIAYKAAATFGDLPHVAGGRFPATPGIKNDLWMVRWLIRRMGINQDRPKSTAKMVLRSAPLKKL